MWARATSSAATARRWSKSRSRARPRWSTSTRRRRSSASKPQSRALSRDERPGARPGTDHQAVRSAAGTAPQEGTDRDRAVALAAPQREEFGVDDVVAAGPSAGTESGRKANPRRGLGRGHRQQGSGNDKRSESPSHLVLLRWPLD